jgi:rod shape-determining protein MreD
MLRLLVVLLLLSVLGGTLLEPLIALGPAAPDFTLIALVILALSRGALSGTVGGFLAGLVLDTATPGLLGVNALCKSLAGYAVGRFKDRLVLGLPLVEGGLVFIVALGHDALRLTIASLYGLGFPVRPLFIEALPSALYTAVLAVPLIRLADLLGALRTED